MNDGMRTIRNATLLELSTALYKGIEGAVAMVPAPTLLRATLFLKDEPEPPAPICTRDALYAAAIDARDDRLGTEYLFADVPCGKGETKTICVAAPFYTDDPATALRLYADALIARADAYERGSEREDEDRPFGEREVEFAIPLPGMPSAEAEHRFVARLEYPGHQIGDRLTEAYIKRRRDGTVVLCVRAKCPPTDDVLVLRWLNDAARECGLLDGSFESAMDVRAEAEYDPSQGFIVVKGEDGTIRVETPSVPVESFPDIVGWPGCNATLYDPDAVAFSQPLNDTQTLQDDVGRDSNGDAAGPEPPAAAEPKGASAAPTDTDAPGPAKRSNAKREIEGDSPALRLADAARTVIVLAERIIGGYGNKKAMGRPDLDRIWAEIAQRTGVPDARDRSAGWGSAIGAIVSRPVEERAATFKKIVLRHLADELWCETSEIVDAVPKGVYRSWLESEAPVGTKTVAKKSPKKSEPAKAPLPKAAVEDDDAVWAAVEMGPDVDFDSLSPDKIGTVVYLLGSGQPSQVAIQTGVTNPKLIEEIAKRYSSALAAMAREDETGRQEARHRIANALRAARGHMVPKGADSKL